MMIVKQQLAQKEIGSTPPYFYASPELVAALKVDQNMRNEVERQRAQALVELDIPRARALLLLLWNPQHRPN